MDASHAYYDALERLNSSVKNREFVLALIAVKDGLRATPATYAAWRTQDFPIHQVSNRFTGPTAGALAALYNDEEAFELMAHVVAVAGVPADVDRFRAHAVAIDSVRTHLSKFGRASLAELKNRVSDDCQKDLSRLVDWMAKNGELRLEGTGPKRLAHWGGTGPAASPQFPFVREGRPHIKTTGISLTPCTTSARQDPCGSSPVEVRHLKAARLPPSWRSGGVMRTHVVGDRIWLIGRPRSSVNASSHSTECAIIDGAHPPTERTTLDYGVVRVCSSEQRGSVSILDYDTNLRICRDDGSLERGASLAEFENLGRVVRRLRSRPYSVVRSVDFQGTTGELVLAIGDELIRLDRHGEPVVAMRFESQALGGFSIDDAEESDGSPSLALTDLYDSVPEWVYFTQFSRLDDAVYAGMYNGQLLKFDSGGSILEKWTLDSAVVALHEFSDSLLVATRHSVYRLIPGEVSHVSRDVRGAFLWKGFAIAQEGQCVDVLDTRSWVRRRFSTPNRIRAVYPLLEELIIDQGTTFSRLRLQ